MTASHLSTWRCISRLAESGLAGADIAAVFDVSPQVPRATYLVLHYLFLGRELHHGPKVVAGDYGVAW